MKKCVKATLPPTGQMHSGVPYTAGELGLGPPSRDRGEHAAWWLHSGATAWFPGTRGKGASSRVSHSRPGTATPQDSDEVSG